MPISKQILKTVTAYPHPTGGNFTPNPSDRRVIAELVKVLLDNWTILRPSNLDKDQFKAWRRQQLKKFTPIFDSLPDTQELPFDEWVNQLPPGYQINL